jgi:PAS domain S-box-containing protein
MAVIRFNIWEEINVFRVLALVAALLFVVEGHIQQYFFPSYDDPLWFRYVLFAACINVFIFSFYSQIVRQYIAYISYGILGLILTWLTYVLYFNNLNTHYSFTAFICFVAMSMVFFNPLHFRVFVVVFIGTVFFVVLHIPQPEVSVATFIIQFSTISIFNFIIIHVFLKIRQNLQLSNANFQTLIDNAEGGYILMDKTYTVRKYNFKAHFYAQKFIKRQMKEGDNILEFLPVERHEPFKENFASALMGRVVEVERRIRLEESELVFECKFLPVVFSAMGNGDMSAGFVLFTILDVTEVKLKEQANKRIEDNYKLLANNISDMVAVISPQGEFVYATPSCESITGELADQMRGKHCVDYVHPDDAITLQNYFDQIHKYADLYTQEFRVMGKESNCVWVEVSFKKVFHPTEHKLMELIAVARDISDRKAAEEAIVKSEALIKGIFNSVNLEIWAFDKNYTLLAFNQAHQDMMKTMFNQDVKIGSSYKDVIKLRQKIKGGYDSVFEGETHLVENEIISPDNQIYWGEYFISPLKEKDQITGALVIGKDITQRKQMVDALRQSEESFRNLFEYAPIGMAIISLDGGFIKVNSSLCNTFGYTEEELLKLNNAQISHPEDYLVDLEMTQKLLNGEMSHYEIEKRFIQREGSVLNCILKITLARDAEQKPSYLLAQVLDISDRIIAEKKLKQKNAELKKTNAELDRFVYSVAHDLRAPLASVLGLINICKYEEVNTIVSGYLSHMERSIEKLDKFIRDIIDYSKNTRVTVEKEEINFEKLIKSAFDHLNYIPGALDIVKSIKVTGDCSFVSDSTRLGIVLNNLIANAIKFRDDSKKQSIISVWVKIDPDMAIIEIKDNGLGIDTRIQDKIFNMFFRANEISNGAGLGLYIVKESLGKLNGEIELNSVPGEGSTFTVKIPNCYVKV